MSGNRKNDGKDLRDKIKKAIKKYDPTPFLEPEPEPTPTPTPTPEPEPAESSESEISEEEAEEIFAQETQIPDEVDSVTEILLREKFRSEIDVLNELFLQRYQSLQEMNAIAEKIIGDSQET